MHAYLIALIRNHFDHNEVLTRAQLEELENLAYHETPPVMYFLEDGKRVEELEIQPAAHYSTEELAERELACQG